MAKIWVQGTINWDYPNGSRPPRGAPYRVLADRFTTVLAERPTKEAARAVAKAVRAALNIDVGLPPL